MSDACICSFGGLGNLGYPSCVEVTDIVTKQIFVPTYDSDGNRNSILATDFVDGVLPESFILGKLIEDPSKRWYMTTGSAEDAILGRTERTTETTSSGAIYELLKGQLNYSGNIKRLSPAYEGQLSKAACGEISVFYLDQKRAITGERSDDKSELYPIQIQKGSFVAEWMGRTTSNESMTNISYQHDRSVVIPNLWVIPSDSIGVNLEKANSLIDVDLTQTSGSTITATSLFVTANYSVYGSDLQGRGLTGKTDTADWLVTLEDLTPIAVSAVVEVTTGNYELTITSTVGTNVIVSYVENRDKVTRIGFESNKLTLTTP